tara:strand:+ start:13013 stop:14038 length:1026 start_codon:yes stop_codon:yes gene_type:complete
MARLTEEQKLHIIDLDKAGLSGRKIEAETGVPRSTVGDFLRRESYQSWWEGYDKRPDEVLQDFNKLASSHEAEDAVKRHLPKVLVLDIETSPNAFWGWGMFNQNYSLAMVKDEWFILSYAAKWLGDPEHKVMYNDMRGVVHTQDDKFLLEELWNLLNEADIVLTQNGVKFDTKKINARLILNGFPPPSSYKQIDTLLIAKRNFGFLSNKLEYMTDKLNVEFKKLKHQNYAGFELWRGMMNDEHQAWQECKEYNEHDVFSLEELYIKLAAWDAKHPNFSLYFDEPEQQCRCGSTDFKEDGYAYTAVSKFQRYRCNKCGAESRSRKNLFTKEKRESLTMNISQ